MERDDWPTLRIDHLAVAEPPLVPDPSSLQWIGFPVAVQRRTLCAVDHQRRGAGFQRRCCDLAAVEGLAAVEAVASLFCRPDGVKLLAVALQQRDAVEDFSDPR